MAQLDWLIVAPRHEDLEAVDAEIAAIAAHHTITPQPPLTGYVNDMDVRRAVTEHECDVFHWITHTTAGNLQLSDGYTVDADTLAQFCLSCKAELCIIDACVGERLAERVAYLCACDVIYSPVNIEDRVASLYMAQYAAELAKLDDYHAAYQAVGSHGGQYKFIRAKDSVTRGRVGNSEIIADLCMENQQMKASITTFALFMLVAVGLSVWIGWTLNTYREEMQAMRLQMSQLQTELRYIQRQLDRDRGQSFFVPSDAEVRP